MGERFGVLVRGKENLEVINVDTLPFILDTKIREKERERQSGRGRFKEGGREKEEGDHCMGNRTSQTEG